MRQQYKPAPQNTAVAQSESSNQLVVAIEKFMPQIARVLPKHLSADRMTRILMTEVRRNPALAQCDQASFFGAILTCSQLGLEPGSALGHAYLIPRNRKGGGKEVQLTIGYQGMLDLVERDGRILIDAHAVYENDFFELTYGTAPILTHKPFLGSQKGELVGVYALARYKDGRSKARFLNPEEINEARKSSTSGDYGPWKTNYVEMAMKTAIRRLFKMLPKSAEVAQAIELEERTERGESQELQSSLPPEIAHRIPEPQWHEESMEIPEPITLSDELKARVEAQEIELNTAIEIQRELNSGVMS